MNPNHGEDSDVPIDSLKEQERDTAPDFFSKVRNKIHRRTAASQVASYSWHLPKVVLIEMASVLGYIFTAISGNKDSQR